jgi:hypothetical protein
MSMVELEKLWGRRLAQVASVQQEKAAEAERSRAAPPTDDRAPAAARGAELAHLPGAHMLYLDTALAQWLCKHTQSRQLRAAAISALQAGPVSAELDNSVVTWGPAPIAPEPDEPSERAPPPDVQAQVAAAAPPPPPPPRRGGVDVAGPVPPPSSRPRSSSSSSYADRAAGSTCRAVRRRAALSAELSAVQMGHLREREAAVELPRRRRRSGCSAAAAGRRGPTGSLAEQPPPPPPQREQLGRLMTKGGRIFAETCFG